MLILAVYIFEFLLKPTLTPGNMRFLLNFFSYVFYVFVFLGILEAYLRQSMVNCFVSFDDSQLIFHKSSIVPLSWFNKTRSVSYLDVGHLVISNQPLDLGADKRFLGRLKTRADEFFSRQSCKLPNQDELCYLTIIESLNNSSFHIGLFDFSKDITNYNNAITKNDAQIIFSKINNKVNLKFVFN